MPDLNPYDRTGAAVNDDLHVRTIGVAGMERSYWSATRQPRGSDVPLLIAIHDSGMAGHHLAKTTGLARRAAQAGFHVVFPDALERYWDDHGTGRRDQADDALFIQALIEQLDRRGEASGQYPFITGVGNGASFTELVARTATVSVSGFALVSGTARAASRDRVPRPLQSAAALIIHGAKDKTVARAGLRRPAVHKRGAGVRGRRALLDIRGHEAVELEQIAADWEDVNAERRQPVVVRSIAGAGEGWPGARGALRSQIGAPVASESDATAIILEFAREAAAARATDPSGSLESPA